MDLWPAFVSVLGAIAGLAVLSRLLPDTNRVVTFVVVGMLCGAGLIVWLITAGAEVGILLANVVVFAFMCELYMFLFTLVGSSISASVLLTLASGLRTGSEIEHLCSERSMVDVRLERLLRSGMLHSGPAGYMLTPRARLLVIALRTLRRFFHHPQSNFGVNAPSRQRD